MMSTNDFSVVTALRASIIQFSHLPRTLRLVWSAAPRWTAAWAALLLAQGLAPLAVVALSRPLVDSLAAAAAGGWVQIREPIVLAVAMAGVLALSEALGAAVGWAREAQAELVQDHIGALVH